MITRIIQIGNSKITVHSPSGVIAMTPNEQTEWFKHEFDAGNPVVRGIAEKATEIYLNNGSEG